MTSAGPDRQDDHTASGELSPDSQLDTFELLQDLEADRSRREFASERAAVFREIANRFRAQGRELEAQRAETKSWLFDFRTVRRAERTVGGHGRFAPIFAGGGRAYPHADMFTGDSLLTFKEELEHTSNPIHRALYADFIWDQKEKYPGPKRDAYEAAKSAIDSYLEAARLYRENEWDDQLVDALDRACELAQSIKVVDRLGRCKETCFELAEELTGQENHPPTRWAIDVLAILQQFGKHLTRQDHERILALVQAGAEFYAEEAKRDAEGDKDDLDFHLERSFLELLPVSHRALGSIHEADAAVARQAETYLVEAERASKALVRLHMIERAIELYQQLGDSHKVDELKRRLSVAGTDTIAEMHEVVVEARVPTAVLEGWVNRLATHNLDGALKILGTTDHFTPKMERIRAEAEEMRRRHPLQHLASPRTLDSAGRIVHRAENETERIAESEADAYNRAISFSTLELGLAFDRLETEKGLTAESLMAYLRSRPIFEPVTLDVVAVGVERYFANDYVSALHVLVPQLEDTFRDILAKMGLSRTSVQQGTTREKPLDMVLKTPELCQALGEDLATFYERLLVDPASQNVRNRTGHGLLKVEHCRQGTVRWVQLCFLQLARLDVRAEARLESSAPSE